MVIQSRDSLSIIVFEPWLYAERFPSDRFSFIESLTLIIPITLPEVKTQMIKKAFQRSKTMRHIICCL